MSNSKAIQRLVKELSGQANVIAIPRVYISILNGDITAALFLSQCVYWSDKSKRDDGFFYKSYREWNDEIGLSMYQVKRSTGTLAEMKLIETFKKRANGAPTIHYKVDIDALTNSIIKFLDNRETLQSDSKETLQSDSKETRESLTETTQETTQKINNSPNGEVGHSKSSRKLTELQQAQKELEQHFSAETNIPIMPRKTARDRSKASVRWWQPLKAIWLLAGKDTDVAKDLITTAVIKMRADKLTLSAPASIQEVCISLAATGNYSKAETRSYTV